MPRRRCFLTIGAQPGASTGAVTGLPRAMAPLAQRRPITAPATMGGSGYAGYRGYCGGYGVYGPPFALYTLWLSM